ncbi:hypothetical protein AGMMS50218_10050 [Actinomycetota bacterium]|nr:hypothetical protein AGMMS50218_10050 [Actinomycetota bacterium]
MRPPASRAGTTPSSGRSTAPRSGSSRPASRSGGSAAGGSTSGGRGPTRAEPVQQRLPRLFSIRVLVLGLVTLLAFVLVFPTLRSYLAQRAELDQLNAQVEAARARNEDLTASLSRWDDRAYVIAQARERLSFVMPGETPYRVVDPETVPDTPVAGPDAPAPGPVGADDSVAPWYSQIWDSVRIAGEAEVVPADGTDPATLPATDPATGTATDPAAGSGENGTPTDPASAPPAP